MTDTNIPVTEDELHAYVDNELPAERHDDGRDFVPTNKWVLFGHHFAAIAYGCGRNAKPSHHSLRLVRQFSFANHGLGFRSPD